MYAYSRQLKTVKECCFIFRTILYFGQYNIHIHTHTVIHVYMSVHLEFITHDKSFWNYIQKMTYCLTTNQDGWVSHSSKCHGLYNEGIKENIFLCPISTQAKTTAICLLSPTENKEEHENPQSKLSNTLARLKPGPPHKQSNSTNCQACSTYHLAQNLSKIWSVSRQQEIQHTE